ncbi:MAG: cytochrome c family protein [Acidobacteriota bacterium]|nr:cytochrome c family protein [Acidobacteriota bacterium]
MPQVFHHSTNTLAKLSIFGGIFVLLAVVWAVAEINRSSYNTGEYVERQQPVQFSHKHHTGDDGIDCRYCHTSVEISSSAGMPATKTCMNCHTQIWSDSPYLEIVRTSWKEGKPIEWTKVHDLPDYVYFNHSIHVAKGVGCSSCHGRMDEMPVVYQAASLQMEWCLSCHREPERFLRPKSEIYNHARNAPNHLSENTTEQQLAEGRRLKAEYRVKNSQVLTSCSTCHR